MSFFGKIFGRVKKQKSLTTGEAIQKLKTTEEMLLKKQDFLEERIEAELTTVKKNASKNKRAAIAALKRKKRLEMQLKQIDGTLTTLEMQREALENATTSTETVMTLKYTSEVLKKAHNSLDVDKVHDMISDISDQQALSREISDAISSPIGIGNEFDEDELERELEELEQEKLDKELLGVSSPVIKLPNIPTTKLSDKATFKKKAAEDDEDMKELMSWAN